MALRHASVFARSRTFLLTVALAAGGLGSVSLTAQSASADNSDQLVVVDVTNAGTQGLSGATVLTVNADGSATNTKPVPLPTADAGAAKAFTLSGDSNGNGALALSADATSLSVAGYHAVPGPTGFRASADPKNTTALQIQRMVARISTTGGAAAVDTSTVLSTNTLIGERAARRGEHATARASMSPATVIPTRRRPASSRSPLALRPRSRSPIPTRRTFDRSRSLATSCTRRRTTQSLGLRSIQHRRPSDVGDVGYCTGRHDRRRDGTVQGLRAGRDAAAPHRCELIVLDGDRHCIRRHRHRHVKGHHCRGDPQVHQHGRHDLDQAELRQDRRLPLPHGSRQRRQRAALPDQGQRHRQQDRRGRRHDSDGRLHRKLGDDSRPGGWRPRLPWRLPAADRVGSRHGFEQRPDDLDRQLHCRRNASATPTTRRRTSTSPTPTLLPPTSR